MSSEKMTPQERRAASSLAAIMSLRMLGLFMILPVFSLYAHELSDATPFLIGIAMGVYGLTQGLFQIPFGMLSDHWGRKRIITLGLIIFMIGSMTAACSHSIYSMILARALQGAGAVGSTIIALIADLTRENQRTKAMAINGITIGISFSLAMILGPVFAAWLEVSGIFWLAAGLSVIGILVLFIGVPNPQHSSFHSDAEPEPAQFLKILLKPQLALLNSGVFLLHAIFTASFVIIPISLNNNADLASQQQWILYVPALLLAFGATLVMIMTAEKKHQVKQYFIASIAILAVAEAILALWPHSVLLSALGLFFFFTGFSLLEAFLPSWVSRAAPKSRKGTALGIYSSSQFLGIFVGGTLGGWLFGAFGLLDVYLFCIALALIWLLLAFGMKHPPYSTSRKP